MLSNLEGAGPKQILIFALDEPRYALHLSAVERVVQAVEITPLPKAPQFVQGAINMQGQVIPVVDIRACFGLPPRELNPDDCFILARTTRRLLALVADSVAGIHALADQEWVAAEQVLPGVAYIHGLAKVEGDLVLLCDLDQFLSWDAERKLEAALAENAEMTGCNTRRKTGEAT